MRYYAPLLVVLLFGCQNPNPQTTTLTENEKAAIKAEILELNNKFVESVKKFELNTAVESMMDQSQFTFAFGGVFTWEYDTYAESVNQNAGMFSLDTHENIIEQLRNEVVVLSKTSALLLGEVTQTLRKKDGTLIIENSKQAITQVWEKKAQGWKLIHIHFSAVPPTES